MVQRMSLKKLIPLGVAIVLIVAIVGFFLTPQPKPENTIILGYIKHAAELPIFIALEKGYFEEEGIKVILVPLGYKEEMDALIRGDIDIIPANNLVLPLSVEIQSPSLVKIHSLGGITSGDEEILEGILVLKESPIFSLEDLKGKKIGVPDGVTDFFSIKTILKKVGVDPDNEVEIIEMKAGLLPLAFTSKQVDAIYITQPALASTKNQTESRYIIVNPRAKLIQDPYWSGAGVVTKEYIEKNPELFDKYLQVVDRAIEYTETNPTEARSYLAKYTSIDEAIVSDVGIYFKVKSTQSIDWASVQSIVDTLVALEILPERVDIKKMYIR